MKHYEIAIQAERHQFLYECSTISEAYDAICDASVTFGIGFDLNKVMITLVEMHNGKIRSSEMYRLSIYIKDGEV